jgi:hypothetical protein
MSADGRPPLLQALLELKPNTIYAMGSAKAISYAASYFSEDPVRRFSWGASGKMLEAEIADAEPFSVRFIDGGGRLDGACERCDYSSDCHHVLAAAMTIARVLRNARFHKTDLPASRVEALREQIMRGAQIS